MLGAPVEHAKYEGDIQQRPNDTIILENTEKYRIGNFFSNPIPDHPTSDLTNWDNQVFDAVKVYLALP